MKGILYCNDWQTGPCWIDIPVNFQGSYIETEELEGFDPAEYEAEQAPAIPDETVDLILDKIRSAKRPVFYAGNGIRISGGYEDFRKVVELLGIPVATGWDSIDAIEDEHPLYVGRGGIMGDRAGNFAVQNADLVFACGNRLSIRQVGYNYKTWARAAYVIVNDIDEEELKKPSVHVDMPVHADAADLLSVLDQCLDQVLEAEKDTLPDSLSEPGKKQVFTYGEGLKGMTWNETCAMWKKKYPVVQKKHWEQGEDKAANVYAAVQAISSRLKEGQITVVGNGSACVVGGHAQIIKKGQRFISNSAVASMGYDLPAAIGAVVAEHGNLALNREALKHDDIKDVILVTGDGSIQMNIQELQTIIHHQMPVKIFVINNQGYHSIRQTQTNLFEKHFVGIGPESGDLSFPDMGKLAPAYGYPFFRCETNAQLDETISKVLAVKGPAICEIMVSTEQKFEPKSADKAVRRRYTRIAAAGRLSTVP